MRVLHENAMNVKCGQCPAKYAVSDERIRDKKVRIHCKRCHASIVVDGKVDPPLVTSSPAKKSPRPGASIPPAAIFPPPSVPPPPDSQPSPRPVAHTIMGGLEAPVAERLREVRSTPPPKPGRGPLRGATPGGGPASPRRGMPGPERGFTDPPAGVNDRWRVALTKQDLRWMTTEEIAQAYRAGAVKHETFVFRTGMPTWVTLLEVPEIAQALSGEGARDHSSLPPPRKAKALRDEASASGDELPATDGHGGDPEDPLPFALVSERSNGKKPPAMSAPTAKPASDAFLTLPLTDARAAELTPSAFKAELRSPAHPNATTSPNEPADGPALNGAPHGNLAMVPGPLTMDPPSPPDSPELMPFAAAHQAGGSSRWTWITIAVLLIGAALALLGPRFGFKLL
jgi:predicted Zn finger-like uncharacterized protein